MAAAICLRGDYTADDLRRLAKASRDAKQTRRLLALARVYDGGSRTEAARVGGVGLQVVRDSICPKIGKGAALEEAGVELTPRGAIAVDDRLRTTRPGTYAAGDVTGRDQFVYMAAYGAKLAALNALNGDPLTYSSAAMPWVVFTDPQVAGVGMTEAQARAAGHKLKISIVPLEQVPRALAARDTRGLIKLVADARTDRILGGQILAPEGGDSIQTLALALEQAMTAHALGETLFPNLTTVEALKLAAQGFLRDVARLSCCAG